VTADWLDVATVLAKLNDHRPADACVTVDFDGRRVSLWTTSDSAAAELIAALDDVAPARVTAARIAREHAGSLFGVPVRICVIDVGLIKIGDKAA
jgi:hypothetical protein